MAFPLPPSPLILLKRAPQGPLWLDLPDHPQTLPRLCPDLPRLLGSSDSAQTLPEHIPALPGLVIVIPFLPDFLLHAISGLHAQKVDSVYSLEYCIHSTVLCIHISAREFLLTLSAPFLISCIARHTSALSLDHIYFHTSYIDCTLFEGAAPAAPLFHQLSATQQTAPARLINQPYVLVPPLSAQITCKIWLMLIYV